MAKEKGVNWEPDIKKGIDIAKNIKESKDKLKKDFDIRKIEGFNPSDVGRKK